MNPKHQEIEQRIARAVEQSTPDVLPQILLRLDQQKGNEAMTYTAEQAAPLHFAAEKAEKKPVKATWRRWAATAAAALALLFGAGLGVAHFTPQSVVAFDINPSIELKLNRNERVLQAIPHNEDAKIVLDGMDLKNAQLDVAVNALIGSMVKNGYINEIKNSILITVDSSDEGKGKALQERLAAEVDELLSGFSVNGAVLSQPAPKDDATTALAAQYGISTGKAALVNQLVSQDDTLQVEDIAALPINDINLLLQAKHTELHGVTASGEASKGAYIGEEKAKELALAHAGVQASAASRWEVELDYDDGRMIYELEFYADGAEYEYEIDAVEGTVRKHEQEKKGSANSGGAAAGAQTGSYIGEEKAKEFALAHAGVQASAASRWKVKLDTENGRKVYEVEFYAGDAAYEYEIDATTGEVRKHEQEQKHTPAQSGGSTPKPGSTPQSGGTQPGTYIGKEKAKEIALAHAKAPAADIRKLDIDLDQKKGRMVYEVEFVYSGLEFEYRIDALTGELLWWESERD